jgi:hypothetical protein
MIEEYKFEIAIIDNFTKDNLPALIIKYNWNGNNIKDLTKLIRIIGTSNKSDMTTNTLLFELIPDLFTTHLEVYTKFTFEEIKNLILKVAKND